MNTDELSTGGGSPCAKSKKREGEKRTHPDLPTVIGGGYAVPGAKGNRVLLTATIGGEEVCHWVRFYDPYA